MRLENWRDLMAHKAGDDVTYHMPLINQLINPRGNADPDFEEAVYWVRRWKMEKNPALPYALQRELEDIEQNGGVAKSNSEGRLT